MLGGLYLTLEILFFSIVSLVGVLDGIIDGLTGASGGMLNVPILNLLGVPIKAAIGTSLAVDVIGDVVVAYTYNEHKNIDIKLGVPLMIGTVIGAQIGSALGSALPSFGLESVYAIFLILGGIFFLITKGKIRNLASYKKLNLGSSKIRTLLSIVIGLVIGSFIVILGGGGGMIILLVLLFVFGLPMNKAIGTSVMVEIGSSLSGCLGYSIRGNINLSYGLILMIGITIGGRLTAKYANKIKEKALSELVGIIKITLGVSMIFLKL